MSGRLEGKRALITAAGQGIGRATAIAMSKAVRNGNDVNAKALKALSDLSSHSEPVLDVRIKRHTSGVVTAPDILFNCHFTFWHNIEAMTIGSLPLI